MLTQCNNYKHCLVWWQCICVTSVLFPVDGSMIRGLVESLDSILSRAQVQTCVCVCCVHTCVGVSRCAWEKCVRYKVGQYLRYGTHKLLNAI